jgi:Fe2+ or Zn2+ uptake regulation protein
VESARRNTKQLEVVWDAIKEDASHPTADQVYDRVRKDIANISLGTVYRNLQKLVADGRLQVLNVGRSQHFDPLVKPHQHFICDQCGGVYDVFLDTHEKIVPSQLPHEGFQVTSHHLSFHGTCKHCAA